MYPHFARFDGTRIEPVAQRLFHDSPMRTTIYPGDDRDFALALHEISQHVQPQVFKRGGWDGYPAEVKDFIRRHVVETD
ncbi:hypothetical protein [Saccharothrix deserti]|uniref:hypothetical protein n=1 Tax=Saccharothrix deserti TaxID=2593674 RepID=UPI00131A97EA|nr:hypothetical protein [Saccharothrix deserti]